MASAQPAPTDPVELLRRFNRFYTRQLGLLQEGLLDSHFSLTEGRVLYELAQAGKSTAKGLCNQLGLDPGYLSRILRVFEKKGLLRKSPSPADGRQSLLDLTPEGDRAFAAIDSRSSQQIAAWLRKLSPAEQRQLVEATGTVERLLAPPPASPRSSYLLRSHQAGDMGWVVHRHGVLYGEEWGYDEHFEALVAQITAEFIANYKPKRERCWIAEKDGEIAGSVLLVEKSKTVAKLRLLLVEPSARGLGIGQRLVEECVRFARQAGYKKISLWTQSELQAARHIYQRAGFGLVQKKKHHSWGKDLVSETWELEL
jgi:DNA-binding MarR family transcriptional regulator/N-acetylglutamate synthase-like GNAT family acetyltransferase